MTIINIAEPEAQNILTTEEEKVERYQDLALEIKRIHRATRVTVIPTLISVLGTISKNPKAWYERLSVPDVFGSVLARRGI